MFNSSFQGTPQGSDILQRSQGGERENTESRQIRGGKGSGGSRRRKTGGRIEEDGDGQKVRKCKSEAAEQRVKRGERTRDDYGDCWKKSEEQNKADNEKNVAAARGAASTGGKDNTRDTTSMRRPDFCC